MISVILPTYNRSALLRRAVDSVLCQTWSDFELIMVDDGSTDRTREVIGGLHDERIRLISNPERRGASAARNQGIQVSKGETIAFQDSDDEWLPQKLERQMEAFQHLPESYGVVYSGFQVAYRSGRNRVMPNRAARLAAWFPFSKMKLQGDIHFSLLRGNFITTQSALVRKECFNKAGLFDERLPRLQDWDLWLRISRQYKFKLIRQPLVRVYSTPESISSDEAALIAAFKILLEKHLTGSPEDDQLLAQYHYAMGDMACQRGEMLKGRHDLQQAVLLSPANLVYRVAWAASWFGQDFYCRLAQVHGFGYGVLTE